MLRLSYSHIRELVAIADSGKREFYEEHCLRAGWSVRELRRQIDTLYYERTALSTDKETLEGQALATAERDPPIFPIRDPYVFEFLGLKPAEVMGESDLEDALLDKLQEFLLELGHGFCFEARQKRLLIGNTYNFVDLVFYHRVLKCHVLVELKVDKFTHEHIGQLNTYVSWYTDNEMTECDNPPARRLWSAERSRLKQEATRLLPSFRGDLSRSKHCAHTVCEIELASSQPTVGAILEFNVPVTDLA